MDLSFNRSVQKDVDEIIDHYEAISDQLASRFFRDMETRLSEIQGSPKRFPKDQNYPLYRKVKMRKFPYCIIYRVLSDRIRILVIKHENRKPSLGMRGV